MTSNLLCLNPSKTKFILIGLREQLKKIPDPSISLNFDSASTHTFTPISPVRNLPRQQKLWEMNGAHLESPIRGELGYVHRPQLFSQIHCPIVNQIRGPSGKEDV